MCGDCKSCVCRKPFSMNCAHYLSNWMIVNGMMSTKPPESTYECSEGRPARAKDMRKVRL